MATFFTGDTHFGDLRVLRFDHRPFATLDDHDRALVERWNETVGADDEVWHLGDFALGPSRERVFDLLAALNGTSISSSATMTDQILWKHPVGRASAITWSWRSTRVGWSSATIRSAPGTASAAAW
jgi:hypothetical protein